VGPETTVGGFKIKRLLGKGGMGEVYLARQLSMDRDVALKILPTSMTQDDEDVQRFLQEVRMAARLEHPHIVRAYEAGEDSGVYYLAMSYVKGDTLAELLAGGGVLEERDALAITQRMAAALAHAWDKFRILHRDIKPANIILDEDGDPKLMDMGLSKSLNEDTGMTMAGSIMGTPNYMSPEQAHGEGELDCRSDMYSLGATLYHMLSGTMPFDGSSMMATLRKQATESLPDPRETNPDVSEACVGLLEVMLAKDPGDRHPSWQDLIEDLNRVLAGKPSLAHLAATGESVLLRRASGSLAKPTGASPKKALALGPSTIRKLHDMDQGRHHAKSAKPSSKAPMIAIGIAAAVLLLAGGMTAFVVSQNKKTTAIRATLAAQQAETKRLQSTAHKPQKPPVALPRKAPDPKPVALKNPDLPGRAGFPEAQPRPSPSEKAGLLSAPETALKAKNEALRAQEKTEEATVPEKPAATPPPAEVVKAPKPPDEEKAEVVQQTETDLNPITDALLRLDFDAVRKEIDAVEGAGVDGMDDAQWQAIRKLALKAAALPDIMQASLKKNIGREVSVQLKKGTQKVRITAVKGTRVMAERVIRSGGRKVGTAAHNFALSDLSVQEQFRRLGKGTTPDLHIMRGLLAYAGRSEDRAKQYFGQSESELGKRLTARIDAVQASRETAALARKAATAEADAGKAYALLVQAAGFSATETEVEKLALSIRKKKFTEDQVARVRKQRETFLAKYGDTTCAKDHVAVFEVMGQIRPEFRLSVDQATLDAAMEQLKEDNPGVEDLPDVQVGDDGDVVHLHLRKKLAISDISALAGLPIRSLDLEGTTVDDLQPLKCMPLTFLNLGSTQASDLSPLKGMPLEKLVLAGAHVSDLSPLRGMPLEYLRLDYCSAVTDLRPLEGMPLEILYLQNTEVSSLEPLEGMPLTLLHLHNTDVRDLRPLKGMPLTYLNLSSTYVRDLKPLKGMPLKTLGIRGTTIKDLSPVNTIPGLTIEK